MTDDAAPARLPVEAQVKAACADEDYELAATLLLKSYGPEVVSFLIAKFRGDIGQADEVFSQFAEDLWRGLTRFEWRCSARAFCYTLARNAFHRHRRSPHHRPDRVQPLTGAPVEAVALQVRSSTRPYLKTENKDRLQQLREELPQDDQDLLVLRIDRGLSWKEVAHAMQPDGEDFDERRLHLYEQALRQRFTGVKKRLAERAEEIGLIPRSK